MFVRTDECVEQKGHILCSEISIYLLLSQMHLKVKFERKQGRLSESARFGQCPSFIGNLL